MTTIAFDGTTLAADKRVTHHSGVYYDSVCKGLACDSAVIGIAGDADIVISALYRMSESESIMNARPDDLRARMFNHGLRAYFDSEFREREFEMLIAIAPENDNGTLVYHFDSLLLPVAIGKRAAIGSGAAYALGAMEVGTPAARAVEIASRFDPETSFITTSHALRVN